MFKSDNFENPLIAQKNTNTPICNICEKTLPMQPGRCPHCGSFAYGYVDKSILLPLTLFLGGIGVHKFYLCQKGQGIFYLLFFWTAIPAILSFFEFMVYMSASSEQLNSKYSAKNSILMDILDIIGIVMAISVLAAIEMPIYQNYTANLNSVVIAKNWRQ